MPDTNELMAKVLKWARDLTNDLEGTSLQMVDLFATGKTVDLDSLNEASFHLIEASMWLDRARRRAK